MSECASEDTPKNSSMIHLATEPIKSTGKKGWQGRHIPESYKAKAIALYAAGLGKQQIADRLGISLMTIYKWLKKEDFLEIVEEARDRVKAMIPKAAKGLNRKVEQGHLVACLATLRGTGVLQGDHQVQVQVNVLNAIPQDLGSRYQLPASEEKVIEQESEEAK